jgi:hypothetical protein
MPKITNIKKLDNDCEVLRLLLVNKGAVSSFCKFVIAQGIIVRNKVMAVLYVFSAKAPKSVFVNNRFMDSVKVGSSAHDGIIAHCEINIQIPKNIRLA